MIDLCVLFGGRSAEYEVSLRSAYSVLQNVDRSRFRILPVGVSKEGKWFLYTGKESKIPTGEWILDVGNCVPAYMTPDRGDPYLYAGGEKRKIDVVFPVMHGANCEDGRLQGLLEMKGLPFVGSGCASSAVCMDKVFAKTLLMPYGVRVADFLVVNAGDLPGGFSSVASRAREKHGYPLFVKPANAGSSVGVSKAGDEEELKTALGKAAEVDRKILVEEYVAGREIEVAVFGSGESAKALACGEVVPGAEFYDYDDKYNSDKASLSVPAPVSEKEKNEVLSLAEKIYAALDCRGLARVDFFLRPDGTFVFNEINTLPGFTSISLYPRLAACAGIGYGDLIALLVEDALRGKDPE